MKTLHLFSLSFLMFLSACSFVSEKNQNASFDVVIKNGVVIDGTGKPGSYADVFISDGLIAYVGRLNENDYTADQIIDATGMIVTPGFIDTHAHGDPLKTPEFRNFLSMGVTTICLGQDGSHPGRDHPGEWMQKVDALGTGPNIAIFAGHGSIRRIADVDTNPNPTPEQIESMKEILDKCMKDGCLGLSSGLEYIPGMYANPDEMAALAGVVAANDGLIMSHMRSEDDDTIEDSLDELIAQGEAGGCPVHVSHIKVVYGHGAERAEQILKYMDDARKRGVKITADIYPYTASYTGIGIVFPKWAKEPNDYEEVKKTRRDELAEYLRNRVNQRNGPEATLFGTKPWSGKTLAQVAEEMGKPFEDVLIDDIGPGGAGAAYFVMDDELQARLMADPYVMICSDGSPTMRHPRGHGSFARIIRKFVLEEKRFSLNEGIRKMTGLSAETLGLDEGEEKRGFVKTGFAADQLVFDPAEVKDLATFEEPHIRSEGFDWIIVNGKVVRDDGTFTGYRAGKVLRNSLNTSEK